MKKLIWLVLIVAVVGCGAKPAPEEPASHVVGTDEITAEARLRMRNLKLVTLRNGETIKGVLKLTDNGMISIISESGVETIVDRSDLVKIKSLPSEEEKAEEIDRMKRSFERRYRR